MVGFDKDKYLEMQSKHIIERIQKFGEKLYLEFGGKLFDDYHASRVLPGFDSDLKIKLLEKMKDKCEVIITIASEYIEKSKIRADIGITYDTEILRIIDNMRKRNILVNSVVITKYTGQKRVDKYIEKLKANNINVYTHKYIEGYPNDIECILSEDGFGANDHIPTTKNVIVVTAPGPGSGKLAVCLSQCYNDNIRGIKSGYAKFETFPVWNLSLKHPVNLAYEAATADLNDVNMIDSFHLEKYGVSTVNYNRDLESFPLLKKLLFNITHEDVYYSPTDMGVNMVGYCINNDDAICTAAKQEILRRYYKALVDLKLGNTSETTVNKIKSIIQYLGLSSEDRPVISASLKKKAYSSATSMAIMLKDGRIICGRETNIMTCASSTVINALKTLSNIDDSIPLISSNIIKPMLEFKQKVYSKDILNLEEVLLAISICSTTNEMARIALEKLPLLNSCEAHLTSIPNISTLKTLKALNINYTCEPIFYTNDLYKE